MLGSPLAVGAVHRPTFLIALGACLGLGLLLAIAAFAPNRPKVPLSAVAFPFAFLLLAVLQSLPIPPGLRASLDPQGNELLSLANISGRSPLSLDPPLTFQQFAKAAGALAVTLAAYSLASGRRFRRVPAALVGTAGLLSMLVGMVHRAIGESKIYGLFHSSGGLLLGPLVNPNHQAELYSLCAFATLAVAYGARDKDRQRGIMIFSGLLMAAAIATLSRGSILALAAGALSFLAFFPRPEDPSEGRKRRFLGAMFAVLLVGGMTWALKGDDIIQEFSGGQGTKELKLQIWWDALAVFLAHPMGIGLGAFARVYPVYQTIPIAGRAEFPENQLIGLLVEGGVPGLLLMLAALILSIRFFISHRRRDEVEAALLAGLVAVLIHNWVDFGLEVPGVLFPFCALLGTLFGRQSTPIDNSQEPVPSWSKAIIPVASCLTFPISFALLSLPSSKDFDSLIKKSKGDPIELIETAATSHPTDYYYAYWRALFEPDRTTKSIPLRLRWLNRAMILCPTCMEAHWDTARLLWQVGNKSQALVEYRLIAGQSPDNLWRAISELNSKGAAPAELETFETPQNQLALANNFANLNLLANASALLARMGDSVGIEDDLLRARLSLLKNDLPTARQIATKAKQAEPHDPRPTIIAAECAILDKNPEQALAIVREGLRLHPLNLDLTRKKVALLSAGENHAATEQAIVELRSALVQAGAPTFEANVAAANVFHRQGLLRKAISEYQAALSQHPDDIGLRLALADVADQSGNVTVAQDSYREVLRRDPDNPTARNALSTATRDKKLLDALMNQPTSTPFEGLK